MVAGDTITLPIPVSSMHISGGGILNASALPYALSIPGAAQVAAQNGADRYDLVSGNTSFWIVDPNARLGFPPAPQKQFLLAADHAGSWGASSHEFIEFGVGRYIDTADIQLSSGFISTNHVIVKLFPHLVSINNTSSKNGVFIGGAWLPPGESFSIRPDMPFTISFESNPSPMTGSFLVAPLTGPFDNALEDAMRVFGPEGGKRRKAVWSDFYKLVAEGRGGLMEEPVTPQSTKEDVEIVTPPQIGDVDEFMAGAIDENGSEGAYLRTSVRNWIEEGRLESHFKGKKDWSNRLLSNVQKGGVLLPTHSTDLEGALGIMGSGQIDPQHFKKKRAFFRYGLGHSYGQIVFVQHPGYENLGRIKDIWDVMYTGRETRDELYRLAGNVGYNRDMPVKERWHVPWLGDDNPAGLSICLPALIQDVSLMELLPQFETKKSVPLSNTYAVLVPEHLYDELLAGTPAHLKDLLVKIPGTGRDEKAFMRGRDDVVRRSRLVGGNYEPKIGADALYRYELTYFKMLETIVRMRSLKLRNMLEEFATLSKMGRLSHDDIVYRIQRLVPYLPEAFRVLHLRQQYPSHDGYSPLGHTFNALIEAAYLAPALAEEFPHLRVDDAFIAMLFHDVGKLHDAKSDEHANRSVEITRHFLKMMGIRSDGDVEMQARHDRILHLITEGGIISEAKMRFQKKENRPAIFGDIFTRTKDLLVELFLLNMADVSSIPGRSGREMLVNTHYQRGVDVRDNMIRSFRILLKELLGFRSNL